MAATMRLEGLDMAMKKFNKLELSMGKDGEGVLPTLMRAGKIIRTHVRANTPVGPTGNLRRRIGVAVARHTVRNEPAVRVHSFAPHAHLIAYGHITASGSHTPPNPYFQRGVASGSGVAMKLVEMEIKKRIDKAAT